VNSLKTETVNACAAAVKSIKNVVASSYQKAN